MNDPTPNRATDTARPSFPRWLMLAMVATATVIIGSGVMITLRPKRPAFTGGPVSTTNASPLGHDEGLEGLVIPPFRLLDQHGKPVDQSVFDGRVTILDFSFTNCPFVCPGMTAAMLSLQSQLLGTGVRFASISVDPVNDTPETIKAHADKMGVDHERWAWMTGEESEIRKIVSESLKFEVQDDPSRPITLADGSTMNNIMHPSRLFLIGPDRQVLALYAFNDNTSLDALKQRAIAGARMLPRR